MSTPRKRLAPGRYSEELELEQWWLRQDLEFLMKVSRFSIAHPNPINTKWMLVR